jgi:hypothetical protein
VPISGGPERSSRSLRGGAPEPQNYIRGQAFHSIAEAGVQLLGPNVRSAMLEKFSEPLRGAFQYGSLVRSGWFPIEWHAELHRVLGELDPNPSRGLSLHKRLGAISAEADITTIYRFILSLGSPHFILANVGRIFATFVKQSETKVLRKESQSADIWAKVPGAIPELWEDLAGSSETILRLSGNESPLVTWKPGKAPGEAVLSASWK